MNVFTIKEIEQICGIKAHTLRIWEQRYKIISPKRKESNHRTFDSDDLKHILRITFLYNAGLKISKIARLSCSDLINMTSLLAEKQTPTRTNDLYVTQLINATLDFDEQTIDMVLQDAINRKGVERAIVSIIYPFFEKIGLLWLTDNVVPAQEHFCSNLIRQKLVRAIEETPAPEDQDNTFVLFTPEGELHELPLLFMHYLLKSAGITVYYLGVNIPVADIKFFLSRKKVRYLYLHAITPLTSSSIDMYMTELAAIFSEQEIIVSGPVTRTLTSQASNMRLLSSMKEILAFGKQPLPVVTR
ncbi:MAG: MerR family transcriptional regulator [Filimonas sp.]|nr:MerR family transcriptional regulator [Filimonas sp.]